MTSDGGEIPKEVIEIRDALSDMVSRLQETYPSLILRDNLSDRGADIFLSDPVLPVFIGDAYPTTKGDEFASVYIPLPSEGQYRVVYGFGFGRERTSEQIEIDGPRNTNPPAEVMWIAHSFGKSQDLDVSHTGYNGRYAASHVTGIRNIGTLVDAIVDVEETLQSYIEHGKILMPTE